MDPQINPVVVRVLIGKNDLREISILPLSVADQFQLSDLLSECIATLAKIAPNAGDAEFVGVVLTTVRKHLGSILGLIVRDGKKPSLFTRAVDFILRRKPGDHLLEDITNEQAFEIAKFIYTTNYEQFAKKVHSLLTSPGEGGLLGRLSQIFLETTPNTDSKTSSENPGPKGD